MKALVASLCAALLLTASGVAWSDSPVAAEGSLQSAADRFSQMDGDHNGVVSWEEFTAAMPQMQRAAFDTIDWDKSGGISREEWNAFRSNHGNGAMGKGQGMPGASAGAPGSAPAQPMAKPGILPPSGK